MANILNSSVDFLKRLYYRLLVNPLIERMGITRCVPRTEMDFQFEIALAEHCNLNCAGCDHFSPLAKPEFANYEEVERDFSRLSSLFHGRAKKVQLLGGEPLLHPELIKFLKMARGNFPDAEIVIVTNGVLLLDQPEEFWLACGENNIVISVSNYPIQLNHKEIEKRAADHGVVYHYCSTGKSSIMKHFNLDVKGLQDSRKNFLLCYRANQCIYLQRGRLYTCTFAPTARHFSEYFNTTLTEVPEDSIDIYQANSAQEILSFLARPIPFCRYCMPGKENQHPWRQSKRAIEEWT